MKQRFLTYVQSEKKKHTMRGEVKTGAFSATTVL